MANLQKQKALKIFTLIYNRHIKDFIYTLHCMYNMQYFLLLIHEVTTFFSTSINQWRIIYILFNREILSGHIFWWHYNTTLLSSKFTLKNYMVGTREAMAQLLRALPVFPVHIAGSSSTCHSSPRESNNILFWTPQAPHTHDMHSDTYTK